MTRLVDWTRRHRLAAFFGLAYGISWVVWPLHAAGLSPWPFLPFGPLIAALVVITVAEGRAGLRALGARVLRWRVGWQWYAVAIGLPLAVRLAATGANIGFGAPMPAWSSLAWTSFALAFALRLVNPTDSAVGEEPGFRGYALPLLQSDRSPLSAALTLGVLTAGWHLPLVVLGQLGVVGLPVTVAITVVYVWLFNHADGSVLLTIVFHATEGAISFGDLGFTGADATRMELLYGAVWFVVALGVVVLDRHAWQVAPRAATPSRTSEPVLA